MSDATHALCFMTGANSIFTGDKLLATGNVGDDKDAALMAKLGLCAMVGEEPMHTTSRHLGLEPGSRCFDAAGRSGIPGPPRDDGKVVA